MSIKESRAAKEGKDVYEKVLVGAWSSFSRPLLEVTLIGFCNYALHIWIKALFTFPPCAKSCFSQDTSICCQTHTFFLAHAGGYLLILFVAGFLGTKFKQRNKLQHSATVTALVIAITLPLIFFIGFPLWTFPLAAIAAFFASFQGYSLWFRLRDRASHQLK